MPLTSRTRIYEVEEWIDRIRQANIQQFTTPELKKVGINTPRGLVRKAHLWGYIKKKEMGADHIVWVLRGRSGGTNQRPHFEEPWKARK